MEALRLLLVFSMQDYNNVYLLLVAISDTSLEDMPGLQTSQAFVMNWLHLCL